MNSNQSVVSDPTDLLQTMIHNLVAVIQQDPAGGEYARQIPGTISVELGEYAVGFVFSDGQMTVVGKEEMLRPLAAIYFKDLETALGIMSGTADVNLICAKDAFIIKGYLPVLAVFNELLGKAFKRTTGGES